MNSEEQRKLFLCECMVFLLPFELMGLLVIVRSLSQLHEESHKPLLPRSQWVLYFHNLLSLPAAVRLQQLEFGEKGNDVVYSMEQRAFQAFALPSLVFGLMPITSQILPQHLLSGFGFYCSNLIKKGSLGVAQGCFLS